MALVRWKEIDKLLGDPISLTGSLDVNGTFTVNGAPIDTSIFHRTGSYYATTNDLQVTGSLDLNLDGVSNYFAISVLGEKKLEVNKEGTLIFSPQATPPTPLSGGIYYGSDDAFYFGFQT